MKPLTAALDGQTPFAGPSLRSLLSPLCSQPRVDSELCAGAGNDLFGIGYENSVSRSDGCTWPRPRHEPIAQAQRRRQRCVDTGARRVAI